MCCSPTTSTARRSGRGAPRRAGSSCTTGSAAVLATAGRGASPCLPGDLARHAVAAVPIVAARTTPWPGRTRRRRRGGPVRVRRGGRAPRAGYAAAVAEAGAELPAGDLVRLAVAEADLLLKAGDAAGARELLDAPGAGPAARGDADLIGRWRSAWTGAVPGSRCRGSELIGVLEAARGGTRGGAARPRPR